eukprot:scaffold8631_cov108-Isochrysis_galbana.AAC.19
MGGSHARWGDGASAMAVSLDGEHQRTSSGGPSGVDQRPKHDHNQRHGRLGRGRLPSHERPVCP